MGVVIPDRAEALGVVAAGTVRLQQSFPCPSLVDDSQCGRTAHLVSVKKRNSTNCCAINRC